MACWIVIVSNIYHKLPLKFVFINGLIGKISVLYTIIASNTDIFSSN